MASNTAIALSGLARRLVKDGLLAEEAAQEAYQAAGKEKIPFVSYLVGNDLANSSAIAGAASDEFGAPLFDLTAFNMELAPKDLVDLKYRTVGLAADLFQAMGTKVTQLPGGEIVPALERGVIEAFEFNNPTSDRSFGAQDVSKVYMMGSYHQAAEYFEIIFNKDKFNALEKEHKAILKYAAEAASSNNYWRGLDQYSNDLQWLKNKAGVKIYRTPKSVMVEQLKAWDKLMVDLEKDPFFKKVVPVVFSNAG